MPERKTIKNRLHLDVHVSGGCAVPIETRRQRAIRGQDGSELGASMLRVSPSEGLDHYGVAMADPEGNEFDIN